MKLRIKNNEDWMKWVSIKLEIIVELLATEGTQSEHRASYLDGYQSRPDFLLQNFGHPANEYVILAHSDVLSE